MVLVALDFVIAAAAAAAVIVVVVVEAVWRAEVELERPRRNTSEAGRDDEGFCLWNWFAIASPHRNPVSLSSLRADLFILVCFYL